MVQKKVFGVGLNKTGTTTLGDMLAQLGLRHQIWRPTNFLLYQAGKTDALIQCTKSYDSFTDWPWPLLVEDLLSHYGDQARFVLTRRVNAKIWLESLKGHALATRPGNNARLTVYGYEYPQENEAAHIRFYNDHLERTRQLFLDQGAEHLLLEVCWEEGDGWRDVAKLLGKPVPKCALPHHNSKHTRRSHLPHEAANLERIRSLVAQNAAASQSDGGLSLS